MKIKRLLQLSSAVVLSLSSLLAISIPNALAAGDTCTWTGATNSNFSNAGNWSNCSSAAPVTGDNVVFDESSSSQFNLTDDLPSNTVLDNITFQGTGSSGFLINDTSPIELSGNITVGSGGNSQNISAVVDFTTNATMNIGNDGLSVGGIAIGSNTLTVVANGAGVTNSGALSGSGTVNLDMQANTNGEPFIQDGESPGFTGTINVLTGMLVLNQGQITPADLLSNAAGINISNGATLGLGGPGHPQTATIAEPITVGGSGVDSVGSPIGAISSSFGNSSGADITFSGSVTLTSNTTIYAGTDTTDSPHVTGLYTFNGPLGGNFTLQTSTGNLDVFSCNNTSATPDGSYSPSGTLISSGGESCPAGSKTGGSGGSSGSGSSSAPKTPDTGLALMAAHPLETLAISTGAAFTILVVARRLKAVKH